MHVRHQIGVMSKVASAFLIPDNHIGRATVSSVAVAHEVEQMGGRSIACLNARDRNLLGLPPRPAHRRGVRRRPVPVRLRRPPELGRAHEQLTVRSMIEELRTFPADPRIRDRATVSCRRGGRVRSAARVEARRRLPLRAGSVLARRAARVALTDRLRRTGLRRRHGRAERRDGAARSVPTSRSSTFPTRGSTRSNAIRQPVSPSRAISWKACASRAPSTACT